MRPWQGPRACRWCDGEFVPTAPDQRFCTKRHAKNYRERLRRQEEQVARRGQPCPHPHKRRFGSEAAVLEFLRREGNGTSFYYPCRCLYWHLTKHDTHFRQVALAARRRKSARLESLLAGVDSLEQMAPALSRGVPDLSVQVVVYAPQRRRTATGPVFPR